MAHTGTWYEYYALNNKDIGYSFNTWEAVYNFIKYDLKYNKIKIMKKDDTGKFTTYFLIRKLPKDKHDSSIEKYYDLQYPEYAQYKHLTIFWIFQNVTPTQEINDLIVKLHINSGITYPEFKIEYIKLTLINIINDSNIKMLGNI